MKTIITNSELASNVLPTLFDDVECFYIQTMSGLISKTNALTKPLSGVTTPMADVKVILFGMDTMDAGDIEALLAGTDLCMFGHLFESFIFEDKELFETYFLNTRMGLEFSLYNLSPNKTMKMLGISNSDACGFFIQNEEFFRKLLSEKFNL